MMRRFTICSFAIVLLLLAAIDTQAQQKQLLSLGKLKTYESHFNGIDTDTVKNYVTNDHAFDWMSKNIPRFECPDSAIEKIYYYRWWTFRKHLKQTPDGFIFTEFISPVSFTGVYNSSSSALGHHVYEGRWLHDPQYLKDYIKFWLYVDPKQKKTKLHGFCMLILVGV